MKRSLLQLGADVVDISPLRVPNLRLRYVASQAAHRFGASYRFELDTATIRSFAAQSQAAIAQVEPDAVVSLSVLPIAGTDIGAPVAFWGDATHANLQASYTEYARLPGRHRRNADRAERGAMRIANVMAYASPWAAQSAVTDYGADPARVKVLPFGANLEPVAGFDAASAVAARPADECRLIWIGADWERKRGSFTVAVAEELRRRRNGVRLAMVGARPERALPSFVDHLGFLRLAVESDRARLRDALASSHFLLLPSRAECFGIVVAEANAHAVPCVGAAVGGIPGAITEGETGFLLDPQATPSDYADRVEQALHRRGPYEALAARAHLEHAKRLNWRASCERLVGWLRAAD